MTWLEDKQFQFLMLVAVKNFDAIKHEGIELEEKTVFKIFKKNLEEFSTKWWIQVYHLEVSLRMEKQLW